MKQSILAALLTFTALGSVACQKADLKNVLTDFQWGLKEACSQEWIPTTECVIGDNGFNIAIDIVNKDSNDKIKQDVAAELQGVISALPADSAVTPFLAGVLAFLK